MPRSTPPCSTGIKQQLLGSTYLTYPSIKNSITIFKTTDFRYVFSISQNTKLARIANIILLKIDYNQKLVISSINKDFYILMQLKQAKDTHGAAPSGLCEESTGPPDAMCLRQGKDTHGGSLGPHGPGRQKAPTGLSVVLYCWAVSAVVMSNIQWRNGKERRKHLCVVVRSRYEKAKTVSNIVDFFFLLYFYFLILLHSGVN